MLAILTETPWDAALECALGPRDALYPLLGVAPPEGRMGSTLEDAALAKGERSGGGVAGASDQAAGGFESYGALARDAGY